MREGKEKSRKKIKKPLDKLQKVCYNKNTKRGQEPLKKEKRVVTDTIAQKRRKDKKWIPLRR